MPWMKVRELASELEVSESVIRRWIKEDGLPSELDPNGVTIVDLDACDKFLEAFDDDGEDDEDDDDLEDDDEADVAEEDARDGRVLVQVNPDEVDENPDDDEEDDDEDE
jgi:hypothetical protein